MTTKNCKALLVIMLCLSMLVLSSLACVDSPDDCEIGVAFDQCPDGGLASGAKNLADEIQDSELSKCLQDANNDPDKLPACIGLK